MKAHAAPFVFGGAEVAPGAQADIPLPISALSNGLEMTLPVRVIHGARPGPVLFVSAAIHGDEIIGVEIIRRLASRPALAGLAGTLLLIPVVNGYGFLNRSRYLPDRRDLNRSFPGSQSGSLAGRLADVFLNEIVDRADCGVDIHSAAAHRSNLPQIRIAPDDDELLSLAQAFGAPVILTSGLRPGSLRQASGERGVPVLLYEAGEGLRFDETSVRAGLAGILRVMQALGMFAEDRVAEPPSASVLAGASHWLRAPQGGLLRLSKELGDTLQAGEAFGVVSNLFGDTAEEIVARRGGILVGRATLPTINEGDAVAHIAEPDAAGVVSHRIDAIVDHLGSAAMFYEDEIV